MHIDYLLLPVCQSFYWFYRKQPLLDS